MSLDQANAEVATLAKRYAEAYPDTNKQFNAGQVEPLIQVRPDWVAAYGERFKETASLEALKLKVDPDAPPPEEEPR